MIFENIFRGTQVFNYLSYTLKYTGLVNRTKQFTMCIGCLQVKIDIESTFVLLLIKIAT